MRILLPTLLSFTLVFGSLTHIVLALPNSGSPKQSTTASLTNLITNKSTPTPTINKPNRITTTNKAQTVPISKEPKPVSSATKPKATKKPKRTKKPKPTKKSKPNTTTITTQTQTTLSPPPPRIITATLTVTGTLPPHVVFEPAASASPTSSEPPLFKLPLPSPSPSAVASLSPPPPPQPTPTLSKEEKEQNEQLQKDVICNSICRPNVAMRKVCGMTPEGTKYLADGCLVMRYNCFYPEDIFTLVDTAEC